MKTSNNCRKSTKLSNKELDRVLSDRELDSIVGGNNTLAVDGIDQFSDVSPSDWAYQ